MVLSILRWRLEQEKHLQVYIWQTPDRKVLFLKKFSSIQDDYETWDMTLMSQ